MWWKHARILFFTFSFSISSSFTSSVPTFLCLPSSFFFYLLGSLFLLPAFLLSLPPLQLFLSLRFCLLHSFSFFIRLFLFPFFLPPSFSSLSFFLPPSFPLSPLSLSPSFFLPLFLLLLSLSPSFFLPLFFLLLPLSIARSFFFHLFLSLFISLSISLFLSHSFPLSLSFSSNLKICP